MYYKDFKPGIGKKRWNGVENGETTFKSPVEERYTLL